MNAAAPAPIRKNLDSEVQFLKGIGPKLGAILNKAGLYTVRDVLYHIPRRYEDRSNLPPISSLRPGDWATVKGRIVGVDGKPTKRGMVVIRAVLTDGKSSIALTWFNQAWIKRKLEDYRGEIIAYGQVKEGSYSLEIHTPEFELMSEEDDASEFARIVPVYPLSDGVSQFMVRKAVSSALEHYLDSVEDPFPEQFLRENRIKPLKWSLYQIHRPSSDEMRLEARKRIVFEDFFFMQAALAMVRAETQQELGISFGFDEDEVGKQLHQMLPFELTRAQRRVVNEIWSDLRMPHPMNRLLQGDVGSGKTAVAAAAMLAVIRSGYQAAIMAPTEILAEQHYNNFLRLFEPLGIECVLLVGKQSASAKKKAYDQTASGAAQIAIGTHALIQEGVQFKNLGLVVIDEQHRFGVLQRAALREKGLGNPDMLFMTATPIPRTLTMTFFGDLDVSIIDELPPGRKPIKTHWKSLSDRASVYNVVRKLIEEGRQAYFVCPMVSENEKTMALAAEELHLRLSTGVYSDLGVGLLHGQMKAKEKEDVMERFRKHELDILVSTTVIEVGVDVPNASVMIIEDSNRFGLSQLHQLRGRVGRGEHQSFCILIADAKTEEAEQRMQIMVSTNDGFKIAEEDLKLRGPGEIAGTKQSGNLDFKAADLVQDAKMLEVARQAAIELIKRDARLIRPEHRRIAERVAERRSKRAQVTIS